MVCKKERKEQNMNEFMKQEMQEAIAAGEQALGSLYQVREKLSSAKNWGLLDMFGGGGFTSFIKHTKLKDASGLMEQAKKNLQVFQRELRDVSVNLNLNMNIGGFLTFADFFFDGLVADYLVQSKISDAKQQVEDAIYQVENIVKQLKMQI